MITTRLAHRDDVPFIVDLGAELYERSKLCNRGFAFDRRAAEVAADHWLALPDRFLIVIAEIASLPVGVLGAALSSLYFGHEETMTVCFWGQIQEARGLGVSRALMDVAGAWAKEHGASHINFLVLPNREQNRVIGALRRRGFEQTETAWTRRL